MSRIRRYSLSPEVCYPASQRKPRNDQPDIFIDGRDAAGRTMPKQLHTVSVV
jgi:hypothetical protein